MLDDTHSVAMPHSRPTQLLLGCSQDDVSRASGDPPRRRRLGWGQGLAKLRSAPSEDVTSPSVPAAAAEAIAAELLHAQVERRPVQNP